MKLVKSLLLGSAASLCAVAGAQAADLPVRKAAPVVEYVRVCTAYGAGFFFIPGTDTCLRVGGRARFEYQYTTQRSRNASNSGFRGLGRLNIDARTQTSFGTLRAFVRFEIASRTGGYLKSGTQERYFNAFAGSGADTFSQGQKFVDVDKAFVQFAGITAGRAQSLFDFYAGDLELVGAGIYSNANTNLLAYTATFGSGFSASISMEDPVYRRNPIFFGSVIGSVNAANTTPAAQQNGLNFISGGIPVAALATAFNAQGIPVQAGVVDVTQRGVLPDFVGVLRYDQAWGSAQIMGAVHELRTGNFVAGPGLFPINVAQSPVDGIGLRAGNRRVPDTEYGFAVGGGLKLNVPQLAPGDQLWLQVAYASGAGGYTGVNNPPGSEANTGTFTNRFSVNQNDAVIDSSGRLNLTETYSGTLAFLHYWTPEVRQGVFATHGQVIYDSRLRTAFGVPGTSATPFNQFNPQFRSYGITYVGSNLIYSPVRDLDIGVEVVYERIDVRGRAFDANRPAVVGGVNQRTATTDDNILTRFRIQRDF